MQKQLTFPLKFLSAPSKLFGFLLYNIVKGVPDSSQILFSIMLIE